ncbi:MAG: hypothetical protein HY784_03270 [Chloroflexi bacterium]|nr:hypothetical protein [Chloroflexota bacterium]
MLIQGQSSVFIFRADDQKISLAVAGRRDLEFGKDVVVLRELLQGFEQAGVGHAGVPNIDLWHLIFLWLSRQTGPGSSCFFRPAGRSDCWGEASALRQAVKTAQVAPMHRPYKSAPVLKPDRTGINPIHGGAARLSPA